MTKPDRQVRVFVSSTFRDMQEERDLLAKRIFPRLRRLCERRGVVWGEVDLRWGITEEERAEGRVLPICLEEIERCRPYFIGILGERYGWTETPIDPGLLRREPWLAHTAGRSVTELEILHGVLNNPAMADHAFFYFRSPSYVESLPLERQADFREEPTAYERARYGEGEARRRAADRRAKLAALKARLRQSGRPVRENYENPETFGRLVFRDMARVVRRLFPRQAAPEPLEQEAAQHDAFAQSRARVYIGGSRYFRLLDEHALGNGPPCVVVGPPGSGKSALLANWSLGFRRRHPAVFVVTHFIGATPDSTSCPAMLRRLMSELKRHFGLAHQVPDDPIAVQEHFADWLHWASARGRVLLVLDGLNQLEDRDGARELAWLPPTIPENVRLVLSALPGPALEETQARAWPTLPVRPLAPQERRELIVQYLAQYTKSLSQRALDLIIDRDQTASPLYLRALLEELRLHGDHRTLVERASHYLAAPTPQALFGRILERYEQDYDLDRPGLVRDSLTLLWAPATSRYSTRTRFDSSMRCS